jgi:hypothetical protein
VDFERCETPVSKPDNGRMIATLIAKMHFLRSEPAKEKMPDYLVLLTGDCPIIPLLFSKTVYLKTVYLPWHVKVLIPPL